MATSYIYGLSDPRDNEVRYVGRAIDPVERRKNHIAMAWAAMRRIRRNGGISPSSRVPSPKEFWITGLIDEGLEPGLVLLEACDRQVEAECEQKWIDHFYSSGHYLVNVQTKKGYPHPNAAWYNYWYRWQRDKRFERLSKEPIQSDLYRYLQNG